MQLCEYQTNIATILFVMPYKKYKKYREILVERVKSPVDYKSKTMLVSLTNKGILSSFEFKVKNEKGWEVNETFTTLFIISFWGPKIHIDLIDTKIGDKAQILLEEW
ncbi:MAG: hypothetical protein ACPLVI_08515 [Thermoplasmata archaeon]